MLQAKTIAILAFISYQMIYPQALTTFNKQKSDNCTKNLPPSGMVSLTFDDGWLNTNQIALPMMEKYGFVGTLYPWTKAQDDNIPGYMSWQQIINLQNEYGWEIGSHTYSHSALSQLDSLSIFNELGKSLTDLIFNGLKVTGIASPYGEHNNLVVNFISKYHSYHRNAFGEQFNSWPNFDEYNLNSVEISNTMSIDTAKNLIDKALQENKWLIFYLHRLTDDHPLPFWCKISDFEKIIAYLRAKNTCVVTVQQGLDLWNMGQSIINNGNFELTDGLEAISWIRSDTNVTIDANHQGSYPSTKHSAILLGSSQPSYLKSAYITTTKPKYYLKFFSNVINYDKGAGNIMIVEYDKHSYYLGEQRLGEISKESVSKRGFSFTIKEKTDKIAIYFITEPNSDFKWIIDNVYLTAL